MEVFYSGTCEIDRVGRPIWPPFTIVVSDYVNLTPSTIRISVSKKVRKKGFFYFDIEVRRRGKKKISEKNPEQGHWSSDSGLRVLFCCSGFFNKL